MFHRRIINNMNQRDNFGVKHKRSTQEEMESLTIHGWPRIATATSNFSKLVWCALCLTSTGLLIYFTVQSLLKHMKYDVVVNTNRIQLDAITFPAVTFCNPNFYSLTIYQNTSPPVHQKFPEDCSMTEAKYFKNEINQQYFQLGCKMFFGNQKESTSQVAVELGYKFKFPQHFSLLPHSYPCFTLNNNSIFKQHIRSSKAGLHILINFDENDRSKDTGDLPTKSILDDPRDGLYVALHSPHDFPSDDGIPLSPGFETRISIMKSIIKRKKNPFPSNCLDDNEQRFENIFPGRPSLDVCYSSCYFMHLYRSCHYVPSYIKPFMLPDIFPNQQDYRPCSEEELKGNMFTPNCKCSLPCYKEHYKTNVMQSVWPQEWQVQKFQNLLRKGPLVNENRSISISDIRKRLIKVVIYYSDLAEYQYEEKELYDFVTILGDFGGQMGLFIGASVISLLELGALVWICVKKLLIAKHRTANSEA